MQSLFPHLEASVKNSIATRDFTGALEDLKQFVVTVMNMATAPGEVVGARKVDELCELVGQAYFEQNFSQSSKSAAFEAKDERMVIVCTGLYRYGGTTLVMNDLINAHPEHECTVIATDFLDNMTPEDLKLSRIGKRAAISICPSSDAGGKLDWLMRQLLDISPSRIFLLNHHQDSVIVSAASAFVEKTNVLFYHHADYNICLGVHLKGAFHIDPHNVGFHNCRSKEGISNNAYLPMTVGDRSVCRKGHKFIQNDELITCSSGHYHKFRNFYLYPYIDMISERLKIRNGKHIHIGGIPNDDLKVIRQKLIDNDIDLDRFVHISWTPSFWDTLVDEKIDLLIGSFPIGGARTTIEGMGAGIPMLMPENYMSRFFSSRDIVYENAFVWKYPSDFRDIIRNLTSLSLEKHSALSREHYDRYYNSDYIDLESSINAICSGAITAEPCPLYLYNPDLLDRRLHGMTVNALVCEWTVGRLIAEAAQASALDKSSALSLIDEAASKKIKKTKPRGLLKKIFNSQQGLDAISQLTDNERKLYKDLSENPEILGFDADYYLDQNPDVVASGIDPLVHFVRHGQHEDRAASYFFSQEWHVEMNRALDGGQSTVIRHLATTRTDLSRKKAAFFVYAWNSARRPDAYISEMVVTLAQLGVNVDVYVAGHYAEAEGTKGFRPDLSRTDFGAFLQSHSYDFALSFNNALVMPETVDSLDCQVVSILVDSMHHFFDHTNKGLHSAFKLPIHAAPIYTSFMDVAKFIPGMRASTSFLPAATQIEGRGARTDRPTMDISWIASMLGDFHIDAFISRVEDELPDGMELMSQCLSSIQESGEIGFDQASQKAASKLCEWACWDLPLLEMHLQEIITNNTRLAAVEKLAPLGLKVFGNKRWRTALMVSPGLVHSFQKAEHLRSHADLCDIYDRSKISINIPQMHAGTGMQYRILDILASKSLLITQYVPNSDMQRLFGENSPIVTFTDVDDLHAKCEYFLNNEDERAARVKACNEMVAKGFSFRERVLDYLALSNPALANAIDADAGPGSVTLIWPDRVKRWAARRDAQAA